MISLIIDFVLKILAMTNSKFWLSLKFLIEIHKINYKFKNSNFIMGVENLKWKIAMPWNSNFKQNKK